MEGFTEAFLSSRSVENQLIRCWQTLLAAASLRQAPGAGIAEIEPVGEDSETPSSEDAHVGSVLTVAIPNYDESAQAVRSNLRPLLGVHRIAVDLELAAHGSTRSVELLPKDPGEGPILPTNARPCHKEQA